MAENGKPSSLAAKLAVARKKAGPVKKEGRNTQQNYDYARAEDVVREAEGALGEAGVLVIPAIESVEQTAMQTKQGSSALMVEVRLTYTIMDAESGESFDRPWVGFGYDAPGDKAIYKAITGAGKYFYAGLLGIPFGDDPEHDSTPATGTPRRQSGSTHGFASDKQKRLFTDLLKRRGAGEEDRDNIIMYAEAVLTGGREGQISRAINALMGEDEGKQRKTLAYLAEEAKAWREKQSDLPQPNLEGLPDNVGDESDPADANKEFAGL